MRRRQSPREQERGRKLGRADDVTPQIALRITLDVAKGKDGSLSGKWGSPDQGAKDLPLESIAYTDGVLTFSAKTAGATYKGKLQRKWDGGRRRMDPGRQELRAHVQAVRSRPRSSSWRFPRSSKESGREVEGQRRHRAPAGAQGGEGQGWRLEGDARQPRPGREQHPRQFDRPRRTTC